MRTTALVLVALLIGTLPPLVRAAHCEGVTAREGISFALCDSDSDGVQDTVRFGVGTAGTVGSAGLYEEEYGTEARIRGHYVFYPGGPVGPGIYGTLAADDHGPNTRYDDVSYRGGAYVHGSGMPRASYVLALHDPNDNGVPDDAVVTVCSTETGCQTLL